MTYTKCFNPVGGLKQIIFSEEPIYTSLLFVSSVLWSRLTMDQNMQSRENRQSWEEQAYAYKSRLLCSETLGN